MAALLDLRPDQIIQAVGFELVEGDVTPGIRFSVYELPRPDRTYVLGSDFALGMVGRDLDTGCVLDATERPYRQVAEYAGTLGELSDRMMYAVAMFYGGAFIVGERQFGLPSLRRLLRDYHYGWLYYERDEAKRNRPVSDKLGYFKKGNWTTDPLLRNFRLGVRSGDIEIRSQEMYDQMRRLQFKAKTSIDPEDALDQDMVVKLSGGGSPDLVMAAAYGYLGCTEVVHFPKPKQAYAPGTFGDILGLAERFQTDQPIYAAGTPRAARAQVITTLGRVRRPR